MNDFDYDVMCKKRIARGDRNRKRGSKSKKCTLGSDYLTKKQWKERCGEMETYNLNRPIEWKVFKRMNKELQNEYLEKLRKEYCVSKANLVELFNVSRSTLFRYFEEAGIDVRFGVGPRMSADQRNRWDEFLGKVSERVSEVISETAEAAKTIEFISPPAPANACEDIHEMITERAEEAAPRMSMRKFTLNFDGPIDVDAVRNSLFYMLGENTSGSLFISFNSSCHANHDPFGPF